MFKLKAEQAVRETPGLNYIIVRPAIIYGVGDKQGLSEWALHHHLPYTLTSLPQRRAICIHPCIHWCNM